MPKVFIDSIIGSSKLLHSATSITVTYVDITLSQMLINMINEIKSLGKLPAFNINVECDVIYYDKGSLALPLLSLSSNVPSHIFGRIEPFVVLSSDEVDLIMRKLKYVEMLKVEVPLPLKSEHVSQDKLIKSINEVMIAKESLTKGNYSDVLRICRNVIMNYLTKQDSREKISEEIVEYILSKVPEAQKKSL